jgi:hypothetical protein
VIFVGALIAMVAASLSTMTETIEAPPIHLTSGRVPGGVRLQVIGAADTSYSATFALEITSGSGNRSRHSGSANLHKGSRVTLSTIEVGVPDEEHWRAELQVRPLHAEPYQQVISSGSGS